MIEAVAGFAATVLLCSDPHLLVLVAAGDGASAQARFHSAVDVVALDVSVTRGESPVTRLREQDFAVYEDGVRQRIRYFTADPAPLDLILLLDASSSMRDEMPAIHGAARTFMDVLRPQDRGAVVTFTMGLSIVQDLTADGESIARAIDATTAHGSTAFLRALYVVLKRFGSSAEHADEVRRRAIVVLSDGADTSSLVTLDEVLSAARVEGVQIYPIRLETMGRWRLDRFSPEGRTMTALAIETGGRAFFPLGVQQLRRAYASIAEDLRHQYSMGYARTRVAQGERRTLRHIRVHLPNYPEYRVRARRTYSVE